MKALFTFFLVIFALCFSNSYSQPYWTSLPSGTTNTLYGIKFTDLSTGYVVGDSGTVRKSLNGGLSWFPLSIGTSQSIKSLSFINNTTGYLAGDQGVLRKTTNGGSNWFVLSSGFSINLSSIFAVNENIVFACGNNGLVIKTTNGGVNWFTQSVGAITNLNSIYFLNSNTGCVVGDQSTIRKTTNGGSSWFTQSAPVSGSMTGVYLPDANKGVITFSGPNVNFFTSNNGGTSWVPQYFGSNFTSRCTDFVDNLYGYIGGDVGSYYTTGNGGESWVTAPGGTSAWAYGISFVTPTHGWKAGTGGSIQRTTNGGTPAPNAPTNLVGFPVNENHIFLSWFDNSGDEQGFKIERSIGQPVSFELIGIVNANVQNFVDSMNLVYGTRYYYRVYSFRGAGNSDYSNIETLVLTNINQTSSEIPNKYKLYNNYPNPFNPSTKIKFDLPKKAYVKISIYNTSGSEVSSLINLELSGGSYEVTFNAENLSSGVYFYRIIAPGYTETKRMILLK